MDLQKIKQQLQLLRCSEHCKTPEVTIRGNSLEFKCCCERFKATLIKQSETLIKKAAKNDIENQIKNIFK